MISVQKHPVSAFYSIDLLCFQSKLPHNEEYLKSKRGTSLSRLILEISSITLTKIWTG